MSKYAEYWVVTRDQERKLKKLGPFTLAEAKVPRQIDFQIAYKKFHTLISHGDQNSIRVGLNGVGPVLWTLFPMPRVLKKPLKQWLI